METLTPLSKYLKDKIDRKSARMEEKNGRDPASVITSRIFVYLWDCCQVASVVSDSVRPHGLQPTRLLRPWDSPGKNTGVGCHFLLQCMKVESESEVTQSCLTLSDPMDCSLPGFSVHGIFRATVLEWGAIAFSIYGTLRPIIEYSFIFKCLKHLQR